MGNDISGKKRVILEMGTGNDLYGADYTKAAIRALEDAFRHSSLTLFREVSLDHTEMDVHVTIGVQKPDEVDRARVAAHLPRGKGFVDVVLGGLDVRDDGAETPHVIATAAIEAFIPDLAGDWRLSPPADPG